jgi:hypothetical protein
MNLFDELENALGEQATRAVVELVFPGQIEPDGITNGPCNGNELPNNYQKVLNHGFVVPIKDSTRVYQKAQGLLGLRNGDKSVRNEDGPVNKRKFPLCERRMLVGDSNSKS